MSLLSGQYTKLVLEKIALLEQTQKQTMNQIADKIFSSLKGGGVWNLFGAGHSHMAVEEAFHRAGGLIPVNAMLEEYLMPQAGPARNGPMERLSGLAEIIFRVYGPKAGEVITIISNSGINATSIEMAQIAKREKLITTCITNIEHSKNSKSRHLSGKKLFEVCDHVIDSGGIVGDAAVEVPDLDVPVGPLSSILNSFTVNWLSVRVCELYSENKMKAPVYLSANLQGGDERNRQLEEKYRSRIPRL